MLCSSAYTPAAATIPACRIAPPKRCFSTRARYISSAEPAISAPSRQPSPFERQSVTVSNGPAISAAVTPDATAAFISRAPSRCVRNLSSRAVSTIAIMSLGLLVVIVAGEIDRAGRRQKPAPADMIIKEQAEPQQPGRTQAVMVRQHEAQRVDDVRRHAQQHLALRQRLVHQAERPMLEVAQAAVDQLGAAAGGARVPATYVG